jgi:hypothetical protein
MRALLTSLLVLLSAPGCLVDRDYDDYPDPVATAPSRPIAPNPGQSVVVLVDADKTMNVTGGEGAGIFVEARSGGKWIVSWTCDSKLTGQSCAFTHSITSTRISNQVLNGESLPGESTRVTFDSVVSNQVGKLSFQAEEGASVTIQSTLPGESNSDGRYFYFVQDGKVNGGFAGQLSNPLIFRVK